MKNIETILSRIFHLTIFGIYLAFLFSVLKSSGQSCDKSQKGGFAVLTGVGLSYGGFGEILEYQELIKENMRLTPFVRVSPALFKSKHNNYGGGINLELGNKLRWINGLSYGSFRNDNYSGTVTQNQYLQGLSFISGYKFTTSYGLVWQINLGVTWLQNPDEKNKFGFSPEGGAGIGYKF